MPTWLLAASVAVAAAAAVRSTWSPCGLSMLSTVTPVAERGRGHRYAATCAWFVGGATAGGATLGGAAAALAVLVGRVDPSSATVAAIAAIAATIAAASDARVLGFHLPGHTRQVNEEWLGRFRPWVYGAGFGWQIGVGLATYIMTSGVYLMVAFTALGGEPLTAFAIVTGFGFLRGLAVLLSAGLTTPAKVFAFHRRFDALGIWSKRMMIAVEGGVALAVTGAALGPAALVAMTVVAGAALVVRALAGGDPRLAAR
jgi:hypothetical protein